MVQTQIIGSLTYRSMSSYIFWDLFQSVCYSTSIIIKFGPKKMIFPLSQLLWWSIPVMQFDPSFQPYIQNITNLSYLNNSLNGSSYQHSQDPCSPTLKSSQSPTFHDNFPQMKIQSGKNKKTKGKVQQQEFKPNMIETKKSRKTPQNANRNVVPNIIHQVISFIQKKSKSENLVNKLILNLGAQKIGSIKRFYFYQLLVKQKLNNYVNAQSLVVFKQLQQPKCQVYPEEEQRLYNKISRLLIQYFLTREFDTIILTSKRVNSDKRHDHLITKRKILQQITKMFDD